MLGGVSLIPFAIISVILIAAVLGAVLILISPIVSILLAILLPLIVTYGFGLPLSNALILFGYEIVVIGVLYYLRRRKSNEISKW